LDSLEVKVQDSLVRLDQPVLKVQLDLLVL
jgi:hypothetical protein